jgi:hypothetical protein
MKLEGAEMTRTVFDQWELRENMFPPGSMEFDRVASLSPEEKRGKIQLTVEYGIIVGKA